MTMPDPCLLDAPPGEQHVFVLAQVREQARLQRGKRFGAAAMLQPGRPDLGLDLQPPLTAARTVDRG